MSQPTHHWHLHYLLILFYNHQILQVPYLFLRPSYLSLSDLISLLLVLQHFCIHHNFQDLVISNFVLSLQTFRLTLQNLQKLLTFLTFLISIMNSLMFSAKQKLKSLLLIGPMIFELIWKKMLNLWLALYTLFQHLNKRLLRNSLRKTLTWVSFN